MSRFIKQRDAMIVWDIDKENNPSISQLVVYEFTQKDRRKGYFPPDHVRYDYLSMSNGNCYFDKWDKMAKDDLICEFFYILLNYTGHHLKKEIKEFLIQFGKIEEAEALRKMLFIIYGQYECNTYDEFIEKYYGE